MATEDRTSTHTLEFCRALEEEPYRFSFFQALRRMECLFPDLPRLGRARSPSAEPVRLGQKPSVVFAPSTLASFDLRRGDRAPLLSVFFLGLLGANGPLPLHLTEYARDRIRDVGDSTFPSFLDVFNHRMLLFFYRAWASAQPTAQLDRPQTDRFALYVGSIFGVGLEAIRGADAIDDFAKFHHAGLFAHQTRNPEGLERIVADFFRVPARIEQFIGRWMELPTEYHCHLGESPLTGSLGTTLILGERIWDCQQKFRIVLGAMNYPDYLRLLTRERLERLVALVRNYTGYELLFDVELVLEKEEVPPCALGEQVCLGWTTWLTTRTPDEDADDLVLNPLTAASNR